MTAKRFNAYRNHNGYNSNCAFFDKSLLEAFCRNNPHIVPAKRNSNFLLSHSGSALDHVEKWRIESSRKNDDAFFVSHPYREDGEVDKDEYQKQRITRSIRSHPFSKAFSLSDLEYQIKNGGTSRSWYYPGGTSLLVIGKPHILNTIKLNY